MQYHEIIAALDGGRCGGEYLMELGITDMAKLTPAQWQEFVCCICKQYYLKRQSEQYPPEDIPY
jgi:hypothetical protein